MFEDVRQALHDLLHGNVPASDRRGLLQEMRGTLVRAKMALDDLRDGVSTTEQRLAEERTALETVRRRKTLAEGIQDVETAALAAKYEAMHLERVGVLERKLEASQAELTLVEREVDEMSAQFRAAGAGVGSVPGAGAAGERTDDVQNPDAALEQELSTLDRQQRRAAAAADADARLAELKRRMGR